MRKTHNDVNTIFWKPNALKSEYHTIIPTDCYAVTCQNGSLIRSVKCRCSKLLIPVHTELMYVRDQAPNDLARRMRDAKDHARMLRACLIATTDLSAVCMRSTQLAEMPRPRHWYFSYSDGIFTCRLQKYIVMGLSLSCRSISVRL